VFICLRGIVTWVFPTCGLFLLQEGKIFEKEHAKQLVDDSQLKELKE
jgi:hypothetical protein